MTVGWQGARRRRASRSSCSTTTRRACRRSPESACCSPGIRHGSAAALDGPPSVHLVTNARALPAERAPAVRRRRGPRCARRAPRTRAVVLRGDSTLRGHLLEEYLGVRDVVDRRAGPPLLLVPALPSAGRVTVGGVHLIERDGRRTPLHETEYARDGVFAYASARLLEWAEERSGGLFSAGDGRELHLDELRSRGPAA